MRLFLVRHGETVHNVAGVYAGVTDSALTNHGVLQANRLGQHLAATDVNISHIFSSDLMRAFKTAEAIRLAQPPPANGEAPFAHETKQLKLLREQDFGSLERKSYSERSNDSKKAGVESSPVAYTKDPEFKEVETQEAMRARLNVFIDEHLLDVIHSVPERYGVVIVAHGIILSHLWRCILRRFPSKTVSVAPGVIPVDRVLVMEHLGNWSNTGYLELEIQPQEGISLTEGGFAQTVPAESKSSEIEAKERMRHNLSLIVKAVNSLEHLKGLKKTRGGIGSSKYEEGQKSIETFFKKRKIG